MADPRPDGAQSEAAAWFARLSRTSVTTDALREFRDWRRTPANAAAYARVEAAWRGAGALKDDPDLRAATAAAYGRRRWLARLRETVNRPLTWGVAAVAAGALAAIIAFPVLFPPSYATGVGEQRLVVLTDGSRVRLNTDSRIAVHFSGRERRVALTRGEAFFEVAHDAAHPFIVRADGADVRALGTRFDVRHDPRRVQVTLVEGSVRVQQGDQGAWILAPSQQLTLGPRGAVLRTADPAPATSWTTGRLIFHETPLATAVAEVNRYARHKIELKADALAQAPVDGVFDTGDTTAFVSAVTNLFDLKATPAPDGGVSLERRPG